MIYIVATLLVGFLGFLARYNFFRLPKKGILVLLYHRIDEKLVGKPIDKFSISPKKFEWQIRYLKKSGFESIKPDDIERIKSEKLYLKKKYVLITFDDGYKDNLKAARILKDYGFVGVFFISTALIGKSLNGVKMLDFDELIELRKMGMILGSHSHEHKHLVEMSKNLVEKQIKTSIEILENIQGQVHDFAYPFGNYDNSVIEILKKTEMKRAYIIGQRIYNPLSDPPFKIPRAIVRRDTNKIDFHLLITRGRSKF